MTVSQILTQYVLVGDLASDGKTGLLCNGICLRHPRPVKINGSQRDKTVLETCSGELVVAERVKPLPVVSKYRPCAIAKHSFII